MAIPAFPALLKNKKETENKVETTKEQDSIPKLASGFPKISKLPDRKRNKQRGTPKGDIQYRCTHGDETIYVMARISSEAQRIAADLMNVRCVPNVVADRVTDIDDKG